MMEEGQIPSQAQLKRWGKLTQEKYRRREGRFLAEGGKVVGELLASRRPLEALLIRADKAGQWAALGKQAAEAGIYVLTPRQWETLSQDPAPEGAMAVAVTPPVPELESVLAAAGPLLLLHRVGNPNNLGALLRTADWFGFRTVLLSEGSCEATNPKAVRASMGSLFHLTVAEAIDFESLLPVLKGRFLLVGSDVEKGVPPHPCPPATALLLGSESHGLPEGLLAAVDERWRISGGGAESLSLPQAAAVMMYEVTRGAFANDCG